MRSRLSIWFAPLVFAAAIYAPPLANAAEDADTAAISGLVDQFVRAANAGDMALAEEVWLHSDGASMIHPHGHQAGWDAIRGDYYEKQLLGSTSKRRLTTQGLVVHLFGDTAVAEFDWVFDATLKANGKDVHATGRESQVFSRMADGQWKLVHVHYSAAPAE